VNEGILVILAAIKGPEAHQERARMQITDIAELKYKTCGIQCGYYRRFVAMVVIVT
jgi:hypothetical protein